MNRVVERRADVSKIIDAVEREKRNAIIEECALVAQQWMDDNTDFDVRVIAKLIAAIRALKDA